MDYAAAIASIQLPYKLTPYDYMRLAACMAGQLGRRKARAHSVAFADTLHICHVVQDLVRQVHETLHIEPATIAFMFSPLCLQFSSC
jgi:hypothetical protein